MKNSKNTNSPTKERVLFEIEHLMAQNQISLEDIKTSIQSHHVGSNTGLIIQLVSFMGGILIFSGVCLYLGLHWPDLSNLFRTTVIMGAGIGFYILAMMLSFHCRTNLQIVTPLFFAGIIFQILGIFATIYEIGDNIDIRIPTVLTCMVMFLQQFISFLQIRKTSLLFLSLVFLTIFLFVGLDLLETDDGTIELDVGLLLLIISYIIDKTIHRVIASFWYLIGGSLFLAGFFDSVQDRPIELSFLFVSSLLVYISILIKNKMLLFITSLSTVGYLGYFVNKHFLQSATWPVLVASFGAILLGVGAIVLRLSKNYK